jgi:hypothetical protein
MDDTTRQREMARAVGRRSGGRARRVATSRERVEAAGSKQANLEQPDGDQTGVKPVQASELETTAEEVVGMPEESGTGEEGN